MSALKEQLSQFIGRDMGENTPPYSAWLKGTLTQVFDDGLEMEFVVRKEMTNPFGLLHGGVQNGMIDDLMGMTLFFMNLGKNFISVNLNVDYFGKAFEGDTIRCRSKLVKKGNTICNIEGELYHLDGKLISRGTSNFIGR